MWQRDGLENRYARKGIGGSNPSPRPEHLEFSEGCLWSPYGTPDKRSVAISEFASGLLTEACDSIGEPREQPSAQARGIAALADDGRLLNSSPTRRLAERLSKRGSHQGQHGWPMRQLENHNAQAWNPPPTFGRPS